MIFIDIRDFLQYDCPGWVSSSTTSLWLLVPCGSLSIRDVLPFKTFHLFVNVFPPGSRCPPSLLLAQCSGRRILPLHCLWFPLCCTRSHLTLVWFNRRRYPPNVTFWEKTASLSLCRRWSLLVLQMLVWKIILILNKSRLSGAATHVWQNALDVLRERRWTPTMWSPLCLD